MGSELGYDVRSSASWQQESSFCGHGWPAFISAGDRFWHMEMAPV